MNRFFKILFAAVDVFLLLDIGSDLVRKFKDWRAGKKNVTPTPAVEVIKPNNVEAE